MITIENIFFSYETAKNNWVLKDLNLIINPGERLAVIGPSGCGKSTLLLLLAGLLKPVKGQIILHNEKLLAPRKDTSIIFQKFNLFPWKKVLDNVVLGLLLKNHPRKEAKKNAYILLKMLGMEKEIDKYPVQLSGGQLQKAAIAKALVTKPAILLMDEPFSAIDALSREYLQDLLYELWCELGFTTILVTHNIEEAVALGTKIIILSQKPGQIIDIIDNINTLKPTLLRKSPAFYQNCYYIRTTMQKWGANHA